MPDRDIVRIGVQKLVERRFIETGALPCARVQERAYPCATFVGLIARRVELKPVAGVQDDDTVYAFIVFTLSTLTLYIFSTAFFISN